MESLLEKLELAIEYKIIAMWETNHYGDVDPKWRMRTRNQEHDRIIAKLMEV